MADLDSRLDTQSMLLDETIRDEQLVQALVQEHAGEFHWLAVTLLSMSDPIPPEPVNLAWRIVAEGFAQVTVERDRIWEQPSLRAWLARVTLRRCQKRQHRREFRWSPRRRTSPELDSTGESPPPAFQAAWNKLGRYEQLTLLLHHVLGLSLAEIAWVFDSEPYPVEYWAREGRWKMASAAPGEGQAALIAALQQLYPLHSPAAEALRSLGDQVDGLVQSARGRRRAAIAAREAILVGLVLSALFFACRIAGLLPEEIIPRYKTPTPSIEFAGAGPLPTPDAPFYFYTFAREGDTLEILAQRAGVSVEAILSLNPHRFSDRQNLDLQPGVPILLPASFSMTWQLTSAPVTPVSPLPLTAQTDVETILERMENHRLYWRTLWADVWETYYGPPGYLGPPLIQIRRQIWLSQPGKALVIFRSQSEPVEYYPRLFLNGFHFRFDPDLHQIYGDYVGEMNGIPWYYMGLSVSASPFPSFVYYYGRLGSYAFQKDSLRIVREKVHAGRQAVVLEGILENGTRRVWVWVDSLTGMILHRLDYSAESPGVVLREAGVVAIALDAEFPADVFNPRNPSIQRFVQDPSGAPMAESQESLSQSRWSEIVRVTLLPVPAPPGFDPSRQPVFLQWPERWKRATPLPGGAATPNPAPRIQVFAGQYFLGSLPLEKVNFNGCRRSPDGRLIALQVFGNSDEVPGGLYWFNLETPQELGEISKGGSERPFAFSPDSRRLAFVQCRELSNPPGCAITIHDLFTGDHVAWQISNDIGEAYPLFLAWSPDARFLAIPVLAENWSQYQVKILDLRSGEIVYTGAYDPDSGAVAPDSPTLEWGLSLPPYDEIEMGCMQP